MQSNRTFFQSIFISPDKPRLRAGWRILAHFFILILLSLITGIVGNAIFTTFTLGPIFNSTLFSVITIPLSVYLARRFLDKRTYESLGFKKDKNTLRDLLFGIALPALIMGFIYLVEVSMGWLVFEEFAWETAHSENWLGELFLWLGIFLAVGYYEELLSRGYHLQNIEEGLNTFWAVLISSAVFGIAHLGNPNATWISALGLLGAGIFLAYGYLRTRQMWLPIGLHIGWNIFEGPIFGFPVSGLNTFRLLNHTISGPELFTGGEFGPEAGLLSIIGMGLGAVLIYYYSASRQLEKTT
ncbi:MAG: CPBP family intramembrane metalloprotease [Chloroflexota bacterium]